MTYKIVNQYGKYIISEPYRQKIIEAHEKKEKEITIDDNKIIIVDEKKDNEDVIICVYF